MIDLFSSAGGLSLGIQEAARALNLRFAPLIAADLDQDALSTYAANFRPEHVVNRSVRSLVDFQVIGEGGSAQLAYLPRAIDEASSYLSSSVDLVMGGPPCQGHSSLNNHTRGDDTRNDLYLTVPALAIALNAATVIIENVPRVVHDQRRVVDSSIAILREAGYFVESGVLTASDLGWPQRRARHFLVASQIGQLSTFSQVRNAFREDERSIWWAISDLEDAENPDDIFLSTPKMSEANRKRVDWLFDNDAYELADHVRPECHQDGHTYPSVYGRLYRDAASPTLTTGFQTPGRGRYVHPTRRRVLTIREAARLQGFPDSFVFQANKSALTRGMLQKWVGDAVPSILGYAVGLLALAPLAQRKSSAL